MSGHDILCTVESVTVESVTVESVNIKNGVYNFITTHMYEVKIWEFEEGQT